MTCKMCLINKTLARTGTGKHEWPMVYSLDALFEGIPETDLVTFSDGIIISFSEYPT